MRIRSVVLVAVVACGNDVQQDSPPDGDVVSDGQVETDAASNPTVRIEPITTEHRAVPGAMFGGWGPHLGHLVRAPRAGSGETATYWVDDLCAPTTPGDCNVDINRRVGVFRRDENSWTRLATMPLSGIQQNTATIAIGGRIHVFGIASTAQRVVECTYEIATNVGACSTIAVPIGALANYVGAAVGPANARMVWWTNVVDGGGGSFSYLVNYGGGWNGPRTGPIGGYNDCGYAHVAFRPTGNAELFCQVVSGLAPNWSFSTLVGTTAATLGAPATWSNGLAPPAGDSIASTNDLFVEPNGDTHLVARSSRGAAVYYYKPAGGGYGAPELVLPGTYRARWIAGDDRVALIHDVDRKRLAIRTTSRAAVEASGALAPASWTEIPVTLPAGFGDVYAIYPVARAHQDAAIPAIEFAVVGSGNEHAAVYVTVDW